MPQVMEGDNENTQRKMKERILETANFTLTVHIHEELRPDARLNDVGYAGNQEADDSNLCHRQFHDSTLNFKNE
jgi:hypothetical protein